MDYQSWLPNVGSTVLVIAGLLFALAIVGSLFAMINRYRLCPSDQLLVIFGRTGTDAGKPRAARVIHGGGAFVLPLIQSYVMLDLKPITVDVQLKDALTKQNIRVAIPANFMIRISARPGVMEAAAQNLLGLTRDMIHKIGEDIIVGQFRTVIATLTIEDINSDREKFVTAAATAIGNELNKVGLDLVNVNIRDIADESGYLKALGQRAAAEALNRAKREVAEQEREGAVGVAEAERDQRTKVATANAVATEGENKAKADVARSGSERDVAMAESMRLAEVARRTKAADAEKEAYEAEAKAQLAKAHLARAEKTVEEVVAAQIKKEVVETNAEAEAEKLRREAKGRADALLAEREAEAKGLQAVLEAQARGIQEIVKAAGGDAQVALGFLIQRQLPELMRTYTEAVKGIEIDKVVLMGNGENGASVSGHVKDLFNAVPQLGEMLDSVGMKLPEWLATGAKPNGAITHKPTQSSDTQ